MKYEFFCPHCDAVMFVSQKEGEVGDCGLAHGTYCQTCCKPIMIEYSKCVTVTFVPERVSIR